MVRFRRKRKLKRHYDTNTEKCMVTGPGLVANKYLKFSGNLGLCQVDLERL